jgi:hypothetical protein
VPVTNDRTVAEMAAEFEVDVATMPSDDDVIYCSFDGGGYEEWCYVLFVKDGELFEVEASHCSCYGFEGQWRPTRTVWAAVLSRLFSKNPETASELRALAKARGVMVGEA